MQQLDDLWLKHCKLKGRKISSQGQPLKKTTDLCWSCDMHQKHSTSPCLGYKHGRWVQERHRPLSVWQRLINLPIHDVLCCVEVEKKLRTKCVEMHQVQSLTLTLSHTTGGEQQICKGKQIMLELSVQVNRWCNQCEQGAERNCE